MSVLQPFDLLGGGPIPYDDLCTLRPPTLDDIRRIGYDRYLQYLHLFALERESFLEAMGIRELLEALSPEEQSRATLFPLLTAQPVLRDLLREALSFFLCETVVFDPTLGSYLLFRSGEDTPAHILHAQNFDTVRYGILQLNCLSNQRATPKTFRNRKAREIYEKIQRGKQAAQKKHTADDNLSLPNLIAAVSVYHPSYNLFNIWGLTVYQLYDQFSRLNLKFQLDITGTRWAAWGTEPFEFSLWFKDIPLHS